MILRHRAFLFASLVLLSGSVQGRADEFPLDEYEKHVRTYLAGIEGIGVDITCNGSIKDGTGFTPYVDEFSFVSIPGYSLMKWKQNVTTPAQITTQWLLRRPDGNFQVVELGPKSFGLERTSEASDPLATRITPFDVLLSLVGGFRHALVSELRGTAGDAHCHIVSFQRHLDGGASGSRLRVRDDLNEFEIDFNDEWLITRKKRVLLETGLTTVSEVSYGRFEGRIVPMHESSEANDPSLQEQWPALHASYSNYRLFNGTPEDFSLKQFGIPDPGQPTKPPAPSRWYLWFLLGGALSGCVAVAFWYRVKRRKARQARLS